MNIILRFRSYGLLPLNRCIGIDTQLDTRIIVHFTGQDKRVFYEASADYIYFLFWIQNYKGPFNGQILDIEEYYQKNISKIPALEAVRYKSDMECYEVA
jgi:hypothetical protein